MNPDIKQKWIDALRSGEYEQTTGALQDEGGYCCLGVLCDIASEHGVGEWVEDEDADFAFHAGELSDDSLIPGAVIEWAEIPEVDEEGNGAVGLLIDVPNGNVYNIRVDERNLSLINDRGASFARIADIIEASL